MNDGGDRLQGVRREKGWIDVRRVGWERKVSRRKKERMKIGSRDEARKIRWREFEMSGRGKCEEEFREMDKDDLKSFEFDGESKGWSATRRRKVTDGDEFVGESSRMKNA